jgi:hypothetical protein
MKSHQKHIPSSAFLSANKKPILENPPVEFTGQVKERLRDIQIHSPKLYPLFFRMYAGQSGLSKSVKAKCLDCTGFSPKEITLCSVITCPLWNHRPYQHQDTEKQDT